METNTEINTDNVVNVPEGVAPVKKEFLKPRVEFVPDPFNDLCFSLAVGKECPNLEGCKYNHDIKQYIAEKPKDVLDHCPIFSLYGKCSFGIRCRASSVHTNADGTQIDNSENVETKKSDVNSIGPDLRKSLRANTYPFTLTKQIKSKAESNQKPGTNGKTNSKYPDMGDISDFPEPPIKKAIDFKGKTFLAPLTTVGNLPFRRICKEFGVDITCSEMAMAYNILQGHNSEWALMKRHSSEDIFGAQICGNNFDTIVQTTELLSNECNLDFIDLNVGCPIDSVFEKGSGSGMLRSPKKLYSIVDAMNRVSRIPITVKYRTGITNKELTANNMTLKLQSLGVALGTLHGRTRLQRYSKSADWEFIKSVKDSASTMSLFGNGDVFSWEDYWEKINQTKVDGIMIGRGALIKPWIFQEINERKVMDITSKERFEMLKKFCDYGLEHWGTDDLGLNHTRRFLCEWQSFLYRYVPVGLLDVLPAKINQRPPSFYGRDELETLMASPNVSDWVKISEMILGPAPEDFTFIPKHKSNSYEG
ncbi:hypothetical protein BB558_003424 [Smittium angustum]|uniref:tRNA-dihydrouridine(47) synthase [NAD(P)(+)] n=1 Tax=Smittium angustum TaxID=133377 RepID=A0A2U1J601_SMIAN|nr:hypothetical protein BB558_003424 [Smittium angustum]